MKTSVQICKELQFIIDKELDVGNIFLDKPRITDWPKKGDIFAYLKNDLNFSNYSIPKEVNYSICTDLHFGWHNQCTCLIHGNLLVAGVTNLQK
jgi:hypothetical protein